MTITLRTRHFSVAFACLLAAGLPSSGCATDDGEPAVGLGTIEKTEGAISAFGIWDWGCDGFGPCTLDLDVIAGRTCFLGGVRGNLQGNSVDVLKDTGKKHWYLQVVQNGHPLMGTAICIASGTATATSTLWNSGTSSPNLGSGANRRCFLGGVRNTNGFTASSDFVQVLNNGTNWTITGSAGKTYAALATCVDVPSTTTTEHMITIPDNVPNTGSFVQSNLSGGWVCGLTHLGGHFTKNDFNDGAWIDYNPNAGFFHTPVWEQNGVNGKIIGSTCIH